MLFKTLNTQKDEKKADGWIFVHILVVPSNMVKKERIVLAVKSPIVLAVQIISGGNTLFIVI